MKACRALEELLGQEMPLTAVLVTQVVLAIYMEAVVATGLLGQSALQVEAYSLQGC